jgi:hypothetical protein
LLDCEAIQGEASKEIEGKGEVYYEELKSSKEVRGVNFYIN